MNKIIQTVVVLSVILCIVSCSAKNAPVDANGQTPEQVMMATYLLILEENYEEAQKNFSSAFIDEFVTSKNLTFDEYCSNTVSWEKEWLKTELVGNDYNEDIWRVKIIPDEGKGKMNSHGIVQDLYLIDGVWKIVFWGHYPKS